jgi:hypothetical protein
VGRHSVDSIAACKLTFFYNPPECPREIANEFGTRGCCFDSGVREMCGNGVQNQANPAENSDAKCSVFWAVVPRSCTVWQASVGS